VPTDEVVFVCVGLLFNRIVDNEDALAGFNLAEQGLDESPKVGRGFEPFGQKRVT
jgi:hypothetical protein